MLGWPGRRGHIFQVEVCCRCEASISDGRQAGFGVLGAGLLEADFQRHVGLPLPLPKSMREWGIGHVVFDAGSLWWAGRIVLECLHCRRRPGVPLW